MKFEFRMVAFIRMLDTPVKSSTGAFSMKVMLEFISLTLSPCFAFAKSYSCLTGELMLMVRLSV